MGMVGKIHHSLVDGLAALQIVSLILDPEPDVESQPPVSWEPRGRPGRVGWALDVVKRTSPTARTRCAPGRPPPRTRRRPARASCAGPARPRRGRRGSAVTGAAECAQRADRRAAHARRLPRGARRTERGAPRRRHAQRRRPGAVAGAVRALLQRRWERAAGPLKAMVPVSMRRIGDTAAGNQISMITIALPVAPGLARIERLEWVREQTKRLKQTDRPNGTRSSTRRPACSRRRCDRRRPRRWPRRGSST